MSSFLTLRLRRFSDRLGGPADDLERTVKAKEFALRVAASTTPSEINVKCSPRIADSHAIRDPRLGLHLETVRIGRQGGLRWE